MNPFVGTWTYRSFFNLPSVEKFEELRFAEAELTLDESESPDFLMGRLSFGDAYLDMIGFVTQDNGHIGIRMRATGIKDTTTEGWIYDYVGHLTASWAHGDGQRPAIVGTVIRTAPHDPQRIAGFSASFIAVHRNLPAPLYKLPETVAAHFASRLHRLHHAAWHGIRNGWDLMSSQMRKAVTDLDWATPRPARSYGKDGVFKTPHINNGSGEDFLFFHRQMIVVYKELMTQAGQEPIEWSLIPEPGDSNNDVPLPWSIPDSEPFERRLTAIKTDTHYWSCIRWWDQKFKDPTYLATLTLGEIGSLLEFSVHGDMHMRWSAAPRDPETNVILPWGRPQYDFSTKWDSPRYDWLGEFYASHVNPFFWRLHGWIDDRIEDWFAAHESYHPGEIIRVTKGGVSWFAAGRWVEVEKPWVWPDSLGGYEAGHSGSSDHKQHNHEEANVPRHGGHDDLDTKKLASLEAVVAVLYAPSRPDQALSIEEERSDAALSRALSTLVGFSDTVSN